MDKSLSAWAGLFLVPINSVLNPYLFTFSAGPRRARGDNLLLNWVRDQEDEEGEDLDEEEEEEEEEEEGEEGMGEQEGKDTSTGPGSSTNKTESSSFPETSAKDA